VYCMFLKREFKEACPKLLFSNLISSH
jgi:hypothetical protein